MQDIEDFQRQFEDIYDEDDLPPLEVKPDSWFEERLGEPSVSGIGALVGDIGDLPLPER